MAADAVMAMTDEDPAFWFRETYDSATGAYRMLQKFAKGGITETVEKIAAMFQFGEVKISYAQRGDLLLVSGIENGSGQALFDNALGICIGHKVAVMSSTGLGAVPLSRALRAWHI